jgi:PAS domain S-box-containing protein
MRSIIRPARALMQRLKYPQKFFLIAVVIAIPFAVIFALLQIQVNESLHTMRQEQAGNAYLVPAWNVLSQVSRTQAFAHAFAKGNAAARPTLTNALAQADANFNALAAADNRYGKMLDTTQSFTAMRTAWADVRDQTFNRSPSDNDAAYGKLIDDLHELFEHVSNTSLLVIDTKLDSTHLTTALLDRLPTGLDLFRQTKLLGQDLPFGQAISPTTKLVYQNLADQLTANLQATQDSFDNAFNANPKDNLRPALAANVTDYASSGNNVLSLVTNRVTNSPTVTAAPGAYDTAVTQAWANDDQLWTRSSAQLDRILQARVDDETGRHRIAQILPLIAALIALYLLVGLYSGLMYVIAALGDAAKRMNSGEIDHTVKWNTRDEMGRVVTSFNTIAARLRMEWSQARTESERAMAAEAKLRSIVDTALDGIVTVDAAGRVSAWNPQAQAIFGWSEREAIGTPVVYLIASSTQSAFTQRVNAALHGGAQHSADDRIEIEAVRRDGSIFPAEVAIASLQRTDSAYSLFVRDITERKRLREQEIDYLRNVALVTEAAAAVEVGDFDAQTLESVAKREDRLGQLARVFQRMAREVASREQQLKQQVQELRIEIDHQKTARQAAEITETDYFRQLQRQASSLRRRSK